MTAPLQALRRCCPPLLALLLLGGLASEARSQALLQAPGPWQPGGSQRGPGQWQAAGGLAGSEPWGSGPGLSPAAGWTTVMELRPLALGSIPSGPSEKLAALTPEAFAPENPLLFGFGGGLRFGDSFGVNPGEPSSGVLTARIGYKLSRDFSLSLRPSLIFGNVDRFGIPNNQSAFQMPLTLDLFRRSFISPYLGGGIATNTDSSGATNPMLSGGVDIRLFENLVLGLNVNYIFQSEFNDTDWEAMSLLYLRF